MTNRKINLIALIAFALGAWLVWLSQAQTREQLEKWEAWDQQQARRAAAIQKQSDEEWAALSPERRKAIQRQMAMDEILDPLGDDDVQRPYEHTYPGTTELING